MGFGMRKEVYTRKPKRAFEKIKKLYEAEIHKIDYDSSPKKHEQISEALKHRIRSNIIQERRKLVALRVLVTSIIMAIIGRGIYSANQSFIETNKIRYAPNVAKIFNRKIIQKNKKAYTIVDYYRGGGIASSFKYKNNLKHQNSESYYSTGEQFRSALYYYDTLVVEYYFYKNGDTIKNYPAVNPDRVSIITLSQKNSKKKTVLKVLDYKVLL